jgi:quercetin dioxygenase-like cupin family protein|tara:strand:- start:979 stop:1371 length:393 start_codon:yes stop_codon:yes gene_type:complete
MSELNEVIVKKIEPVYTDERGSIMDLLNEKLNHVGLIVTEAGATRGNHYHKLSTQYSYILSGKFEVLIAKSDSPKDVKKIILEAGEIMTIPPGIIHRFKAIEKATMIDMISESRDGNSYEEDVVRVEIQE